MSNDMRIERSMYAKELWTAGTKGKKSEEFAAKEMLRDLQGESKTAYLNEESGNRDRVLLEQPGRVDALEKELSAAEKSGATGQVWRDICNSYPGLTFMIYDGKVGEEAVTQMALTCQDGGYVVISKDFLEWMAQGEVARQQGMEMIDAAGKAVFRALLGGSDGVGVVLSQNGEEYLWQLDREPALGNQIGTGNVLQKEDKAGGTDSVMSKEELELEGMKKMLDKMKEAKKKPLITVKKRINYRVGRDMSKLCHASHDRAIRSFISGVYARRAQIGGSKGYDKKEKAAAVAQMDYVIRCARTKIRQVKEEEQLKAREEKLRKAKEEKKRMQVERERKERQIKRRAKEYARIFLDAPDLPGLRSREEQREAVREFQENLAAAGGSVTGATGGAAAVAPAGGISGSAGDMASAQAASVSVTVQQI